MPTFVKELDGKVLPNAHAVADVDGDDLNEYIFGSMNGVVAIFKVCSCNDLACSNILNMF